MGSGSDRRRGAAPLALPKDPASPTAQRNPWASTEWIEALHGAEAYKKDT